MDSNVGCKLIIVGSISHFWLVKDTHVDCLDALTTPVIFLKNFQIYFILSYFIKYLWILAISLISKAL